MPMRSWHHFMSAFRLLTPYCFTKVASASPVLFMSTDLVVPRLLLDVVERTVVDVLVTIGLGCVVVCWLAFVQLVVYEAAVAVVPLFCCLNVE